MVGCPRLQEEAEFFARSIDGKLFMGNGNGVWTSILEMQDRPHQICMHFNNNWWHIRCIWITGGAWALYQTSKSVRLAIYKWLCNPLWASHTSLFVKYFSQLITIFFYFVLSIWIRWDSMAIDDLPDYMKICYLALFNFVNEMAYDVMRDHGLFVLPYLVEEVKCC